ncbi:MAG: hypothetical protein HY835_13385 [Anaerolineae bacterium]|nr:hypothetical protein [Anaerolineae bacterium]
MIDTYWEPSLQLSGNVRGKEVRFFVLNDNEGFRVKIAKTDFSEFAGLINTLKKLEYSLHDDFFQVLISRSDIAAHLKALDEALNSG